MFLSCIFTNFLPNIHIYFNNKQVRDARTTHVASTPTARRRWAAGRSVRVRLVTAAIQPLTVDVPNASTTPSAVATWLAATATALIRAPELAAPVPIAMCGTTFRCVVARPASVAIRSRIADRLIPVS